MKVGIDVSSVIYQTGVSDYTLDLINHLPPDVVVPVGFSLRRQSDLKRLVPNCTTYPIPPSVLHYLWNKFHIANFENFAPGNIDIYHSSDWAQAPDSNKKVTTIHDLAPFIYPHETTQGLFRNVVSAHTSRMHWVISECDRIICVSKSTQKDLHRLFPKSIGRTVVIPEAMPTRFNISSHPSPYKNYLVAIGARQGRKNIPKLISAYLAYRTKLSLPDKLVIVGENTNPQPHPAVVYTGFVSNQQLVDILAGSQAFVYPSLHEGFGLPILVSFHHQVPVACSDISVFHETAGSAAVYFDPFDEESIATGIVNAIKKKNELIKSGLVQLPKFSWAKTVEQTLKVYESLC